MRRLLPLLAAIVAFVGFGVLWIITDERASKRVYDKYSSANTGDEGLSLASGYLARRTRVSQLTKVVSRARLERNAVVFRITEELPLFFDPESLEKNEVGPPRPKQRPLLNDAEDAFVRNGGRFVIATESGALDMTGIQTTAAVKVFPIWPRLQTIQFPVGRAFASLPARMQPILVGDRRVVVARQRIGAGDLILIAAPEALQNKQLPKNLELLVALAGAKRPVYFDEVPHGIISDDGALELMKEWNLGTFLLMLGAVALLLFWREGKRIGPAEEEHRETRSDAVDLVRSLGALYRGVTSDAEAIALYHEAFTRTVATQTGLRGEPLRKRVDELTGGLIAPKTRGSLPTHAFRKMLAQLNQGFEKLQSRR
ncbi:MAG TPA: hypothetical protein VHW00_15235 [Thermoanaerobaculia bacterium]|nr:hypothetical protein [Thermoanaerobaculia bacterium]